MIKKSKCTNAIKEEHRKNGKTAYAVLSEDFTVLTFYYDTHMDERGGLSVGPFGYDDIRWDGHVAEIQIVIFDDSFSKYALLESTAHWFDGCCHLQTIGLTFNQGRNPAGEEKFDLSSSISIRNHIQKKVNCSLGMKVICR